MTRMTGGRALVEMLTRHGVDTLFALPGVQNDALFVALYDAGEAIRVIHPRHEQAAAYMAFGYSRATGKPGAFAVVPGPGLLNTTAALSTAWATNTPVLCISGQIPSDLIGRGFGLLHEIPDQLAILKGLTKFAARISHPTEAGGLVNEAFRQLAEGRPRPVALEMPLDVMALAGEVNLPEAGAPPAHPAPDGDLDRQGGRSARRRETAADLCWQRCDGGGRRNYRAGRAAAGPGRHLYRRQGRRQRPQLRDAEHARRPRIVEELRRRAGGRHPPQPAADPLGHRHEHQDHPRRSRPGRDHPRLEARHRAGRRRQGGGRPRCSPRSKPAAPSRPRAAPSWRRSRPRASPICATSSDRNANTSPHCAPNCPMTASMSRI